jgi:hypothetical protein
MSRRLSKNIRREKTSKRNPKNALAKVWREENNK